MEKTFATTLMTTLRIQPKLSGWYLLESVKDHSAGADFFIISVQSISLWTEYVKFS